MRRRTIATAIVTACLAAASSAQAAEWSVGLSGPAGGVTAGTPAILHVNGTIPTRVLDIAYWVSVSAIPPALGQSCPDDSLQAMQIAERGGGAVLLVAQRPTPLATGDFSFPFAVNPTAPGDLLLCVYIDDGETFTTAYGSYPLHINPAAGTPAAPSGTPQPPAAKPENVGRPRVRLSGQTATCRAGRWANAPTSFTYRWSINGGALSPPTGRRLRLLHSVRRLACSVTASNPAGAATARSRRALVAGSEQ